MAKVPIFVKNLKIDGFERDEESEAISPLHWKPIFHRSME
jgi:hypothetical protein